MNRAQTCFAVAGCWYSCTQPQRVEKQAGNNTLPLSKIGKKLISCWWWLTIETNIFFAKLIVYLVSQYPHLRVFHFMSEKPSNVGIAKIVIILIMCVLYFLLWPKYNRFRSFRSIWQGLLENFQKYKRLLYSHIRKFMIPANEGFFISMQKNPHLRVF